MLITKNLSVFALATAVFLAVMILGTVSASAATISNPLFSNGDTTIDAQGNSTVSGSFILQVGQNEVCEVLRTQSDASQPFTDISVGGQLGYQEGTYTNVSFSVKVPPNTSTVYPTVQCAGKWGGSRSIDGADNVVVGATNLGTLRVTATGSGSVGGESLMDKLMAEITALKAQIGCMGTEGKMWNGTSCVAKPAPVVTKPAFCSTYAQAAAGGTFALQNWLVQNHFMTQAQMNTGPGTYGPRTTSAVGAAMVACL